MWLHKQIWQNICPIVLFFSHYLAVFSRNETFLFFSQHMQMFIETLIRVRFLKMKQKKGLTFLGSLICMIVNDYWADSYIGFFLL